MERTLIILKPAALQRGIVGEILSRFEHKGLYFVGMKMMQLDDVILNVHYGHLKEKSFFGDVKAAMSVSPVIVVCLEGVEAVRVVRTMVGVTNGRNADPGTIRGDYSMSVEQNVIHASDSIETAQVEIKRFFKDEELFEARRSNRSFYYAKYE
jgi:nucleoside-diphosphate kinase